jgi:hypothetical protein
VTWQDKIPTEIQKMCHIYDSYTMQQFMDIPGACDHSQVKRHVKVDIFDGTIKFLFFPICEILHWMLVVVCDPGKMIAAPEDQASTVSTLPEVQTSTVSTSEGQTSMASTLPEVQTSTESTCTANTSPE